MLYYELWNILWNWKKSFSTKEFATTFVSPQPNKVLHDMIKKGMLEREGWGKYKVNSPEEYLIKRMNISKHYELLKETDKKYALTGPDAVLCWTKGGYQVDRFFGFYPIHLKIKKGDLEDWKKFFKLKKQRACIAGETPKETLFGVFFVMYPQVDFEMYEVEGFTVDSLKETVEFCQDRIYSYEPALEMLDEMYNLGLKTRYKEIRTNY
jgi:hypothetical protein